jgi:tetratricopeptide (TPR) repeat protein
VTPLLPPEPVALLVTSRTHVALGEGLTLDLDVLDPGDAVKLLKEEIGTARALDEATLARFAALCGCLPVALLAIAGTIKTSRTRTPAQLLARLEADRAKGLTGVLHRLRPSVEALALDNPDLARRFARLAVFAGDFSIEAATHVWEVDEDTACDGLEELLIRSLLLFVPDDGPESRFRLHDLIRILAQERLGPDAKPSELRHAVFYYDLLSRCEKLYKSGHDAILKGLELFNRERLEIETGQRRMAGHRDTDEKAARLAVAYSSAGLYICSLRLSNDLLMSWHREALQASRKLQDVKSEGCTLSNIGNVHRHNGKPHCGLVYNNRSRMISITSSDIHGEGQSLGNMACCYIDMGRPDRAIPLLTRALEISRERGDLFAQCPDCGNIGIAFMFLNKYSKAVEFLGEQLTLAKSHGFEEFEANANRDLGLTYARSWRHRQALEHYNKSIAIDRRLNNRRGEGISLWNAALAHEALGEAEFALKKAKSSFLILTQTSSPFVARIATWLRERGVDPEGLD